MANHKTSGSDMSIIVAPPDVRKVVSSIRIGELLEKGQSQEVLKLVRHANDQYLHWHSFRYRPVPKDISHEEVWALIKLGRMANMKSAPFTDKTGKPFAYWVPDCLMMALNKIDRWSGGNITTSRADSLAPKEQYIIRSLMDEAIASSQIEGAATTRKAAKEMLRTGRRPRDISEQMILNNWETMQFIRENRNVKLTPDLLLEIHSMITAETLEDPKEAGELRTRDDIVVEYNGKTIHVPPKASELPSRIEALCDFANHNESDNWIHPVIKGAMLHFWLAYDHPFTDGNGRTARALMYHHLLSRDYLLFEYLAISSYILRARAQYVRAYLFTETDSNDLTYFFEYNVKAILSAFEELQKYLDRKQRELAKSNELLKSYRGLNHRQKSLIYHAIRHPDESLSIQAHQSYHAIVYETARRDLIGLAAKGFLTKTKRGREHVFIAVDKMIEKLRLKTAQLSK